MLAKVPKRRRDGKSSFKELLDYITNREDKKERMSDELDSGERRKYIKILERTRSNLSRAEEYLHATRRAYFIDADAIRVRFESTRRFINSNESKYGQPNKRVNDRADGVINDNRESNQHRRSLTRTRRNLISAESYLRQIAKIDSDFQARARANRANLALNAQTTQRWHERNKGDSLSELETGRLLGEAERVTTPTGTVCEHNCLSLATASAEMKAVAAQNVRVKDPVYHVVLSWPSNESPTNDQAFECAAYALKVVGMHDHQYVFAVHRDTDNVHVHIAVNRVHPDTFNAVYPERDFFKLDYAMRELELRYGWQHDKGPYAVFERNGVKIVDWSSNDPNTKGKRPARASDMEKHDNQESLFSYVRGEPRKALLSALKNEKLTWQQLHNLLSKYGLALREKGQGFAIFDLACQETTPIKASDMHESLSKNRLLKRLGKFELPISTKNTSAKNYDKYKEPMRDSLQREERRQVRAKARRELRERYNHYKKTFVYRRLDQDSVRLRYAALTDDARRRRLEVRNMVNNPAARKALYSVIAFETLRARDRLRRQILRERLELKLDPMNYRQPYREWVEGQAACGDIAAISQLRAWAYHDKRQMKLVENSQADNTITNGICNTQSIDVVSSDLADGIYYRVRRDGAIVYKINEDEFIDHGLRIDIPSHANMNREMIIAALKLACKKYGDTFSLIGTDEFKSNVIDIMVDCKMDVRLGDDAQEALRCAKRSAAVKERRASQSDRNG